MSTDYDCWREDAEDVGVGMVVENMKENNRTVNTLLPLIIDGLSGERTCGCANAAKFAVMTDPKSISAEAKKRLAPLYGKYWG